MGALSYIWGMLPFVPWKRGMEKNVENQNFNLNQASFNTWYYRLLIAALSVWEWEGLPEGIDVRQMELWLMTHGYAIFFYDDTLRYDEGQRAPEGYAVLQGALHGQLEDRKSVV